MVITDAYGNPVEPGTPVITLYGSDNKPLPPRKRLRFDSTVSLTDDPASDATAVSVVSSAPPDGSVTTAKIADSAVTAAKLANSGTSVGRIGAEVLIENKQLTSATSYVSPSWAAGTYRRLRFVVMLDSGTASTYTVTLNGLVGGYILKNIYYQDPAIAGSSQNSWIRGCTFPIVVDGMVRIQTAHMKYLRLDQYEPNGEGAGSFVLYYGQGINLDTTSDITGITVAFGGGNVTGSIEVWGLP